MAKNDEAKSEQKTEHFPNYLSTNYLYFTLYAIAPPLRATKNNNENDKQKQKVE